ncbi:MAG: hypothetical protein U0236_03655 [Nitrospira sp.]
MPKHMLTGVAEAGTALTVQVAAAIPLVFLLSQEGEAIKAPVTSHGSGR